MEKKVGPLISGVEEIFMPTTKQWIYEDFIQPAHLLRKWAAYFALWVRHKRSSLNGEYTHPTFDPMPISVFGEEPFSRLRLSSCCLMQEDCEAA